MNSAEDKLEKMTKNYEDLLVKLEKDQEETQHKRRRF